MENNYISRVIEKGLPKQGEHSLVLVTGARQTGKTTLVKANYKNIPYYNLDAPEIRDQLSGVTATAWARTVGIAALDEVQKLPGILEKLKYAYDAGDVPFSVLLGSAQILMMSRIKESLAGRVLVFELWPLMLMELISAKGLPLFASLALEGPVDTILKGYPEVLIGDRLDAVRQAENHLLRWGGMPGIIKLPVNRRAEWLKSYNYTYLERDLADLAHLHNLSPFRKFHLLAAARIGGLLSYSELARDAGLSVGTARHYLEYLRLSYQAFLVQPYAVNLTSTAVKTPKLYWTDPGLWRQLTGTLSQVTGPLFENHVISEMLKYLRTRDPGLRLWFYRTRNGLEVDVLLESEKGVVGIEIKNRETVSGKDATPIKKVGAAIGSRWLGGIVVYRGDRIMQMDHAVWAVPSYRLLTP